MWNIIAFMATLTGVVINAFNGNLPATMWASVALLWIVRVMMTERYV